MTLGWQETPLDRTHDRKAFDCGEPALNDYLQKYAWQNHDSGGAIRGFRVLAHTVAVQPPTEIMVNCERKRVLQIGTMIGAMEAKKPKTRTDNKNRLRYLFPFSVHN